MVAWLNRPFSNQLVFYGPTEALFASIKVSLLAAILASLPVIFYQCWKCIEPALLPKEQRWGVPLFVLAGALFACGLTFCNLVILPLVIDFFVSFGMDHDVTPVLSVGTYIDFNVKFLLIFGCAFELPLVLTILGTDRCGFGTGVGQVSETRNSGFIDPVGYRHAGCDPLYHALDGRAPDGVV